MNTTSSILEHKSNCVFTPEAIRCLLQIIAETSCSIVISSSWREPDQCKILPEVFALNGLAQAVTQMIGVTPSFPLWVGTTREDEVDCWLAEHQQIGPYAILDDIPCAGDHSARWVQTSMEIGLTRTECQKVISLLLGRGSRNT